MIWNVKKHEIGDGEFSQVAGVDSIFLKVGDPSLGSHTEFSLKNPLENKAVAKFAAKRLTACHFGLHLLFWMNVFLLFQYIHHQLCFLV